MKSDTTTEYLPGEAQGKQKAFDIVPHKDDGYMIVQARRAALRDRDLDFGARVLFCDILDLSLNGATWEHRGCVTISVTKLAEHLGCGKRSIYEWNAQLVAANHVWISSKAMPNFWDMNTYHIVALDPRGESSRTVKGDGLWGNGARRGKAPSEGERERDARGGWCKKVHAKETANSSISQQNAPEACSEMHASVAKDAPPRGKTCHGAWQKMHLPVAKDAPPRGKKVHASRAENCTPPVRKGAHIEKSLGADNSSGENPLSCLTADATKPCSGSPAKKFRLDQEREFLERLEAITGPKELANWGGRWRNRFREDSDKAWRVLAELKSMHTEGRIVRNAGACADDLWQRRFA